MDWRKFLSLPIGEPVAAEPDEVFGDAEPIIELTETIRPRLVLVGRSEDGSDLMVALLHDTAADAYTLRGRYRYPDGRKAVAPRVKWLPAEEGNAPRVATEILEEVEAAMRKHGDTVTRLEFPAGASPEEVLEVFAKSGAFDVLKADPAKKEIRRIA